MAAPGIIIGEGRVVPFVVPSTGVTGGVGVLIGTTFAVPIVSVAYVAGQPTLFEGFVEGIVNLPKETGTAITDGETVYWDNTAKNVTPVSTSNTKIGFACKGGALSAATSVQLRLTASAN